MKIFATMAAIAAVAAGNAAVLNFDDINTNGSAVATGPSYDGFNIAGDLFAMDKDYYNTFYSNQIQFPSAPNVAYNGYGEHEIDFTVTQPNGLGNNGGGLFGFSGLDAAFWAASNSQQYYSSTTITVEGWLNGNLVGSSSMELGANFAHLNGFAGQIDTLKILNDGGVTWWLIDNVNTDVAVPEPTSMAALGLGIAALLRRRAKKA
ncbi:MAG: PEP-CTERM sorting domain-containing protein [Armatimonadetes bacterium]|nr:PEP-CTERM sorting domain-containing protein [Armatimonadota bacterium]